ncbi:outer membrane lipoprotein-sorting protein [Oceaniserpentilla sp. 4NH20-0058]|uniref:outer membrane lipoprotein-sorting protein n=1 Tax=Oceaniserpentilla sp. 4NH20-0058 TaxID=3127660 RepID=UPI0031045DE5
MNDNVDKSWKLLGVRRPWLVVLMGLLLMAALMSGIGKIYKDTSSDAFLSADNPALLYKNKVREIFGLSDPMVIAIKDASNDGVYNTTTLNLVANLTEQFNNLEWVNAERTISLATENNIVGSSSGLEVTPFMELLEDGSPSDIREAIQDFPLYDGMLVSKDGAMTVIVLEVYNDTMAEATYEAVIDITKKVSKPVDVTFHVAGEGAVLGFLGHYIDRDASRLNPLAGLIITIMLIVAFRRLLPALLGNVVIAASVLMTVGFMAYSGVPFFVITNAMPVILIGMAVADSIHILSHYYECQARHPSWSLKQCISESVNVMFRPVTLTTLTTIAGFLGLYVSAYMPPFQYFGLFTGFGVMVAWVYSIFLLPALITLMKPKVSKRWVKLESESKSDLFSNVISAFGNMATSKPKVTVSVFAIILVGGSILATQLRVNENRINTFHKDEAIYKADTAINAHLEGTNIIDIVISTPSEEGIFEPAVLAKMADLQKYAESLEYVNGSTSVADYLMQMNKSLNEGNASFYSIPQNKELVAQYFLLYSASGNPTDFEEEVDYDYRLANIRLNLDTSEFVKTKPIIESLQTYIDQSFDSELATASLSGRVNVNYHWIKDLGPSHFIGVLISLICVCLVSAVLFRSLSAGLMATAPVVCSILVVYSAMVILNIDLGIGTSMFASVAIGLGIDFAIHTLERMKTLVEDGTVNIQEMFTELYRSTGRALLFNYLAIAFGFGVLMTSKVVPLTHFGTIVVLSVTMSFIAAMTLLPALVMLLKPKFIFTNKSHEIVQGVSPKITSGRAASVLLPVMALGALLTLGLTVTDVQAMDKTDALEVVNHINSVDDGLQVTSNLSMLLVDKRGKERNRETISYRKYFGDEKKTVFFYTLPANLKGTGFLTFDYPDPKVDDDQWLYLPALRKVRRISSSDRGDYFMGTDLTYEDIKQSDRLEIQDYDFELKGKEPVEVDNQIIQTHVLQATPKNKDIAKELGYGKLLIRVNPENWVVVKTDYWNPKGKHLKTAITSDIRKIDGIWTRHIRQVKNHLTGHQSTFVFSNVDYKKTIPDRLFSKRALVQGI